MLFELKLEKPENQTDLQTLLNYVLKTIGDKGKIKVVISSRLKRTHGLAHTPHYIATGRRKITISKQYLFSCEIHQLIKTLIHEITHFKFSKTRKLRKMWLRDRWTSHGLRKQLRRHDHTKRFKNLVIKLTLKFWNNHNQRKT